jgi:hypothetical protein
MPGSAASPDPHALADNVEDIPWVFHGIAGGVLGAYLIAGFFLVVDALEGRALWTPHLLGSALFLGSIPAAGAPITWVVVIGYTAVHGGVFVAFGLLTAYEAMTGTRLPRERLAAVAILTAALFVAFELSFAGMAGIFVPELLGALGAGRVAIANLLAAATMAIYLVVHARAVAEAVRGAR